MHHHDDDQKDIIALVCFISIFASTGGLYVDFPRTCGDNFSTL